ncbi:MAG: hypothetical protein ABIQ35_13390, partial [Verrucomicrobiota bacterium]
IFSGLSTGSYNVSPQAVASGFTPSNQVIFVGTNASFPIIGTNATNVNFAANPVTLASSGTQVRSNGVFQLQAAGVPGKIYQFQASTNLATWITLSTNTAAVDGALLLTDTNAAKVPKRFFRVIATSQTSPPSPPPLP